MSITWQIIINLLCDLLQTAFYIINIGKLHFVKDLLCCLLGLVALSAHHEDLRVVLEKIGVGSEVSGLDVLGFHQVFQFLRMVGVDDAELHLRADVDESAGALVSLDFRVELLHC